MENPIMPDSSRKVTGWNGPAASLLVGLLSLFAHSRWPGEVIDERGGLEVSYRWFTTRKKAEAFCSKLSKKSNIGNTQ